MNWYNQYQVSPYNSVNKNVGDTVYLTATGSGSAAPSPVYTATFTKSTNASGTIVTDTALTAHYVVVTADGGLTLTFNATVTDNCSTPMTSLPVSSTAIIAVSCVTPTCGFSLS